MLGILKFQEKLGAEIAKSRNAVQPIIWMSLAITPFAFYFATKTESTTLAMVFAIAGCVPVVLFIIAYLYFMFVDPDRLSTEDYQLRSRALDIIESKGSPFPINPTQLEDIVNPYESPKRQLPSPELEGGAP